MGLFGDITGIFTGGAAGSSSGGGGWFGNLADVFMGDRPDAIKASGAFPGIADLGASFSTFLQKRLNTPTRERPEFLMGQDILREQIGSLAKEQRGRIGDTAISQGFRDSGEFKRMLQEIDMGELEAFSKGLQDLFLGLEEGKTAGVLEFLTGGAGESFNVQSQTAANLLEGRQQNITHAENVAKIMGGGMGGGFGCWVADALFGKGTMLAGLARLWMNTAAPAKLHRLYMRHGQELAALVERNPRLAARLRPVFLTFAFRGAHLIG